jgi:hypothetical protein
MSLTKSTQGYLNTKAGTVGLTKQQCLIKLAGAGGAGRTAQDAANNYAGTVGRSIASALSKKAGIANRDAQDASRRI